MEVRADDAYREDLAQVHHEGYSRLGTAAGKVFADALRGKGLSEGLIVDLGCGSGPLSEVLAASGFEVLGADLSACLLDLARKRVPAGRFVQASLFDFQIPPCVGVACVGECLNYLFDPANTDGAIASLFERIHAALPPDGIFLFDVLTTGHAPDGYSRGCDTGDIPTAPRTYPNDHAVLRNCLADPPTTPGSRRKPPEEERPSMSMAGMAHMVRLPLRRPLLRRLALLLSLAAVPGCGAAALSAPAGGGGPANLAALAFGLAGQGPLAADHPVIVGHRGGASGKAPENTMAAFRLGPQLGAAVLECDVHCSKDGALVVIHDQTVDRTTNGKGPVQQLTLDQLKQLDAGGGERIPTLDELLDWTATQPGLGLTVEIKARRKVCPEIADKVVAAVNRAGLASRVMIISFHRDAVERVEQVQPDLRTGLLFLLRLNPIRTAKTIHADMLWPARMRTTSHFVASAHDAKLGVFSWTLDSARHLLEARRVGADAVVTDVPDMALDVFEHGYSALPAPGGDASASADPEDREDPEDLEAENR